MHIEDLLLDIDYPIMGMKTILFELECELEESHHIFKKTDTSTNYYKIMGLLAGTRSLSEKLINIKSKYSELVEKIYADRRMEQ